MSTLGEMVDLAIGTPEQGVVNYNALRSLLHGILSKLQISESPTRISATTPTSPRVEKHGGSARVTASSTSASGRSRDASVLGSDSDAELQVHDDSSPGERKPGRPTPEEGESGGGGGGRSSSGGESRRDSDSKKRETAGSGGSGGGGKGFGLKKIKVGRRTDGHGADSVPLQELARKVDRLEKAWEELNEASRMESFKNIVDDEREEGETGGGGGGRGGGLSIPLKDAWDYLQMHKQVDANKEGVDRLMTIVQDVLKKMKKLTKNSDDQLKLINGSQQKLSDLNARQDDLETVRQELETVVGKVDSLHETRDKEELVTWNRLEVALRGSGESSLSGQSITKTASGASLRTKESQRSVGGGGGGGVETKASTESFQELKTYDGDDAESHNSGGESVRVKDSRQRLDGKASGSVHRTGSSHRKKGRGGPDDGRTGSGGGGPSPDLQEILRVLGSLSEKFSGLSAKVSNIESTDFSGELGKSFLENMANAHRILSEAKGEQKDRSVEEIAQGSLTMDDQALRRKAAAIGALEHSMKIVDEVFGVIQKTMEDIECRLKIQDQMNTERRDRSGLLDPNTGLAMEPVDELISCSKDPEEATQTTESIESNLKNLEARLGVNRDQICQLTKKLNQLNMAVSQQLNEAKDRVNDLETRLVQMTCNIKSLVDKIECEPQQQYAGVPSPAALDESGVSLLVGVQKALTELQADMEKLSGKTDSLQQSNAKQGIEDLMKLVSELDEKKADRTEVIEKASKHDLELKLDTQRFEHTCDDLNRSIGSLLTRISYLDEECQNGFEKLTTDMVGFITAEEFEKIRQCMAKQFKSLTKKLMKMQKQLEVAKLVGDDAAGVKRQIFKCLSCDRTTLMPTNQEPKQFASRDGMLAYRSTKPYTTYELEQLRQHCRGQQSGRGLSNYERAIVERQMSRLKLRDLRGNASPYWKSDRPACCKQYGKAAAVSPQTTTQATAAAAASGEVEEPYPDPYQCMRPCVGVHTITNPYKRMTNVTDVTSMIPDEHQQSVSQRSQQQGVLEDRAPFADIKTRVLTNSYDSFDIPAADAIEVSPLDISNAKSRSYTHPTDHQSSSKVSVPTSIGQISKQSTEDTARRFSDPAVASSKKSLKTPSGSAKSSSGRRTTIPGGTPPAGPTSPDSSAGKNSRRFTNPASKRSKESVNSGASIKPVQENYTEELEPQPEQQNNPNNNNDNNNSQEQQHPRTTVFFVGRLK